ncbi:serine hydrolase [Paraburkholderia sp. RL18-103-BIB-C]|uniref:hypothetical protein n=1 Tax=unclassified Paraburkholderia TaxID=2615204 RepID=UPI002F70058C
MVVDRGGPLFHQAAGEAGHHTMFRNASMTKAVATTAALQFGGVPADGSGRTRSMMPERERCEWGQLLCAQVGALAVGLE